MSSQKEVRINELRAVINEYKPGSTFRFARQRPVNTPTNLRIGLFGPTGVGKSALINSMNYATGDMWSHIAPEGFASQASKTIERNAVDVAECISLIDNRGMISFGGEFMVEVGHQVAGVHEDGQPVEWNKGYFRNLVAGLERAWRANKECQIHCAVLVMSAISPRLVSQDLTELIKTIKTMTGEPPVVVITHRHDSNVHQEALSSFLSGLQDLRVDYVFELENYTMEDNAYDVEKHLVLLEALNQCTIVGDRVMKHKDDDGTGCTIL